MYTFSPISVSIFLGVSDLQGVQISIDFVGHRYNSAVIIYRLLHNLCTFEGDGRYLCYIYVSFLLFVSIIVLSIIQQIKTCTYHSNTIK